MINGSYCNVKQNLIIVAAILTLLFASPDRANSQWAETNGPNGRLVYCFAQDGSKLFAGTADAIYFSTDDAATWTAIGKYMPFVYAMVVSGTHIFAGNPAGVFHSTDYGVNWNQAFPKLPAASYNAFAVSGSNVFVGSDSGVFLTTNNGIDWNPANGTMSKFPVYRLATSGANLFAGTFTSALFVSSDNGSSWANSNTGLPQNATITAFLVNGAMLFLATDNHGMFLSTNSGASWSPTALDMADTMVLSLYAYGQYLFAGTKGGGVFLSADSGASWRSCGIGSTTSDVQCLCVSGQYLVAGTGGAGIWRRPLTQIIAGLGVENFSKTKPLFSSYPNPFSQSTSIKFTSDNPDLAQVSVVNLLGTEVARLYSGELESGEHSFTWDARGMPAGMYICVVRANGHTEELPVMLVK
jgi:photosystem II stability/assembly factor-like uncharacterized protein